jgi:hypothetical protein
MGASPHQAAAPARLVARGDLDGNRSGRIVRRREQERLTDSRPFAAELLQLRGEALVWPTTMVMSTDLHGTIGRFETRATYRFDRAPAGLILCSMPELLNTAGEHGQGCRVPTPRLRARFSRPSVTLWTALA